MSERKAFKEYSDAALVRLYAPTLNRNLRAAEVGPPMADSFA